MKKLLVFIFVVIFAFVLSGCLAPDYEEMYNSLLEEYQDDVKHAYDLGHERGYDDGYDDGKIAADYKTCVATPSHIDGHIEEVDDSTAISGLGYCEDFGAMYIEFKTNGYIYAYFGVPRTVYDGIWEADSKGGYFHQYIRDVYNYIRCN